MRGHLRQRGKSGIWYVLLHTNEKLTNGHDRVRWISTRTTSYREAEKALARVLADAEKSRLPRDRSQSLSRFLDDWLSTVCEPRLGANTVTQRRILIRKHVLPVMGSRRLSAITAQDLQSLYRQLLDKPRSDGKGTLSPRTVAIVHTILHAAFEQAVEWDLLSDNPASRARSPRHVTTTANPMTPEQAAAFLEAARESRYYALYIVAITTGLRLGELLGLLWSNVDLLRGVVAVEHTLRRKAGPLEERLTATKTRSSTREVLLSEMAVDALRQHRDKLDAERAEAGPFWNDHDLVFPNTLGRPTQDGHLRARDYKRVLKRAGLPHFRLHDLRHTMATLLLVEHVHPKIVQERLGHTRLDTTMDIYSHVLPSLQKEAADRIDQALQSGRKRSPEQGETPRSSRRDPPEPK